MGPDPGGKTKKQDVIHFYCPLTALKLYAFIALNYSTLSLNQCDPAWTIQAFKPGIPRFSTCQHLFVHAG